MSEHAAEQGASPIMSVLRGTDERPGRLSTRILAHRDEALDKILQARVSVERLERLERGEISNPAGPRYDDVRRVKADLEDLLDRLDRVYV